MAIQLSDRDMTIFRFIEEHHVLLEKHIAWFISCDEKPVLIRDRLRKLFYLDYLLCQRHGGKLPWWTTPTKPLVYMLSPVARGIVRPAAGGADVDLADDEIQRHLLEVANLRMLFLMDQKSGLISDFTWQTVGGGISGGVSAIVSFGRNGITHKAAIVNHPSSVQMAKAAEATDADMIWVICRDDAHQSEMQKGLAGTPMAARTAFATHQEIYKSGIVKCKWQSSTKQFAPVIADPMTMDSKIVPPAVAQIGIASGMATA